MPSNLAIVDHPTHHVDWVSSAGEREDGIHGLAWFLSDLLGLHSELRVTDTLNDCAQVFEVTAEEAAAPDDWTMEHVETARSTGEISAVQLVHIVTWAVHLGKIPPGHYAIQISW